MQFGWIKRRWNEFRQGHNTYLSFIPASTNSVLLAFNLVAVAYFGLENNLYSLAVFAVLACLIYAPLGVLAGRYHNKKQLPTDNTIAILNSPYNMDLAYAFVLLCEDRKEEAKTVMAKWVNPA